jgi:hypothetical protein
MGITRRLYLEGATDASLSIWMEVHQSGIESCGAKRQLFVIRWLKTLALL